jgi:hypothetical protein
LLENCRFETQKKESITRFDIKCFVRLQTIPKISSFPFIDLYGKQAGTNSLFSSWELSCVHVRPLSADKWACVWMYASELVILSSLVKVACIACSRFSLSLSLPSSYSLLARFSFFNRTQLSNKLTMSNKFFFFLF